jgi:hypothetical protein
MENPETNPAGELLTGAGGPVSAVGFDFPPELAVVGQVGSEVSGSRYAA